MSVLMLLAVSAVSTFVVGLPEATVILYVEKYGWSTWPVAALASFGQCVTFTLLYLGGEQLLVRWRWLGREVAKIRLKFADHLERRFLVVAAFAATIGIPPAIGVAALGGGFQVPLHHLLPVMYVCRAGRFMVIILFGKQLTIWWTQFWA
jgi:membrane protein YqaA with SNARE-associated domain